MPSDIAIAQQARLKRVNEVAAGLGIPEDQLEPYGHYKAKVSLSYADSLAILHFLSKSPSTS